MTLYIGIGIVIALLFIIFYFFHMRMLLTFLILFVFVLILRTGMFIVTEGSQVVITQFGKIIGTPYTRAGAYFKIPFLWKTNYVDKRLFSELEYQPGIATKDGYFITLDAVFIWRISDAALFISNLENMDAAETFTRNIVSGSIRQEISSHNLLETVRSADLKENNHFAMEFGLPTTPGNLLGMNEKITVGREKLSVLMQKDINTYTKQFGIDIVMILIRHIKYDSSVEQIIYSRMVLERLREAARLRSTGRREAFRIKGEMIKKYQEIIAPANRDALIIRGAAEAEATRIQAIAFDKDKAFYNFWRTLLVYRESIPAMSQGMILSTDSPLLKLLTGANDKRDILSLPLKKLTSMLKNTDAIGLSKATSSTLVETSLVNASSSLPKPH